MKPGITTCACALGALLLLGSGASAQVASHQKISAVEGNFGGTLHDSNFFGWSVASLGDLDGDGHEDLAVGGPGPCGIDYPYQTVWVLFLEADGTVREERRIAEGEGGFQGSLQPDGAFGAAVASPGDLDGDGVADLAVGNLKGGALQEGSVWMLFLERDGTVKHERQIDGMDLGGALTRGDWFGGALYAPGDLDGDGTPDLLVGAPFDKDGGMNRGAFYVLHLGHDGGVISWSKIGQLQLGATLVDWGRFGCAVTLLDDLDGDGQREFAVGAPGPIFSQPPVGPGSVWILFPEADGSIGRWQEIGLGTGGFTGSLLENEKFGSSLAVVDDLDGDERGELVVGARWEKSAGAVQVGGIWILSLDADGRVTRQRHVANGIGGLPRVLGGGDEFGCSVAALGDVNRDGVRDLVVGSYGDSDGASGPFLPVGAVRVLFLNEGLAPLAKDYGCGVDPPGSLTRLSGEPRLGAELHLGVDNPLGTMARGAHAWLLLSTAPHPAYPCGALWPGFGMAGPGVPGEFLLDWRFLGIVDSRRAGPWLGPGQPVDFRLGVPASPALLGFRLYAQGLLLDLSGPRPFLGLSTALELRVGSPAPAPLSPPAGGPRETVPRRGAPWGMP